MLRSLMTAVTGVRAHQTMLDVTGNNIANANTTGFKKDNTIFQDLMYQNQKLASAPADGRGGINPAQVGLGVSVGAIETIFTQGAANYTGNVSDMMINGNGFFIYDSGTGNQLYSRSGATVRDADNNLVQSGTGYKLQGYRMEKDPINPSEYVRGSTIEAVNIPLGKKLEPNATTEIKFQCNLDSRSNPYLPYGFADLPYNAHCGWPGNKEGTARITMDGKTYDMKFETEPRPKTGAGDDGNGKDYMTITLDDGVSTGQVVLDMVGIGKDGNPELAFTTTPGTDTHATRIGTAPTTPGDPDNRPYLLTLGTVDPTYLLAQYDDKSGTLKIRSVTLTTTPPTAEEHVVAGETLFEYNIKSNMNYYSFSMKGTAINGTDSVKYDVPLLVEFDESPEATGSNLAGTSTIATIWYRDPTVAAGENAMQSIQKEVFFNAAGAFEFDDVPFTINVSDGTNTAEVEGQIIPASSGSAIAFQQNINSDGDVNTAPTWANVGQINQGGYHQTKQTIYDCNGNPYTLEVNFKKVTENRWRWEAFLLDSEGKEVTGATCEDGTTVTSASPITPVPRSGEIEFCGCGPICNVITDGSPEERLDAQIEIPFSLLGMPNQRISLNMGGDGDKMYGVTQFASETTTKAVYQNGYPMGILEDYSIGTDGTVTGNYSNGQRIPLYRVALATFANQQGLEKVGESMFRATINSGNANIDPAGLNGKGTILSQNLEMSNVDLTEEFTHLIIAQRGFQANTRVITTSDQILEEVVNLKR